jgi:hypothetical protein
MLVVYLADIERLYHQQALTSNLQIAECEQFGTICETFTR